MVYLLYKSGLGGILADDMGLGKTIQTIAFCCSIKDSNPILIIGPNNVIYNWQNEIETFCPSKTSLVYQGSSRQNLVSKFNQTDFIITTLGTLKNDIEIFNKFKFSATFIDEAQYIKNPQAQISKAVKTINTPFKIALTGTPIENNLQDLWSLSDFIMPDYLGSQREFDCLVKDDKTEQIKLKMKPFILRREKKEVLDSLPEKTEITLKCDLTKEQTDLYETILNALKKGIRTTTGKKDRLNMLSTLLKLRQLTSHPNLIKECQNMNLPSAKFELLKEKLLELTSKNHKIVVFSQFTSMLDIIEEWTHNNQINTHRIDGSVSGKQRQERVKSFQAYQGPSVFIISLKAGGVGINLTSADYVIHLEPWWNPAIEAQATDRVHRMGQKNKVIVYKFIAKDTLEEKIQDLQEEKKALISQIIDIDSISENKINLDDIKNLILN